jgi:SAM-dependent methyltransferase
MDLKEQSANPHRHPWELSRADMMLRLLSGRPRTTSYADIGSGDLYFARRLSEQTDERVFAVDVNYAQPRAEGRVVICTDLAQVPPASIDCALLMDVLEHVDDDVGLLRGVQRVLRPSSEVLITVPAHATLWSAHDDFLGHRRRYDRHQLLGVLHRAELAVRECFYFYGLPFMARAVGVAVERLRPRRNYESGLSVWGYPAEHAVTRLLRSTLNCDFQLSRRLETLRWPTCGLSLCAICQRRSA